MTINIEAVPGGWVRLVAPITTPASGAQSDPISLAENQAAVVDKLITGLPEVVRAMSAPLSQVDKITIVSTGNGDAAGVNKITGDMAKMAAQVPALFEALSGMQMSELLGRVRTIGDKTNSKTPIEQPQA